MRLRTLWWTFFLLFVAVGIVAWLASSDSDFLGGPNRIGVIEIRGVIANPHETLKALKEFRKNPNVKAIILRVDSPGGGVGAAQELYREFKRTAGVKPVVASFGGVAASAGYYIASGVTRIVANPGTMTGSIGVISYYPNLQGLFGKIGYEMVTIKSGKFKDLGNPAREMTAEEKELLQGTIDEALDQFVKDVAAGRRMKEETVRKIADGRIIMGQTARQLGLVDEMGNFEDAVNAAAKLGRIEGEPSLSYAKKKKLSLIDLVFGSDVGERVSQYLDGGSSEMLRYQLPFF